MSINVKKRQGCSPATATVTATATATAQTHSVTKCHYTGPCLEVDKEDLQLIVTSNVRQDRTFDWILRY
jgi:hypothetical protein